MKAFWMEEARKCSNQQIGNIFASWLLPRKFPWHDEKVFIPLIYFSPSLGGCVHAYRSEKQMKMEKICESRRRMKLKRVPICMDSHLFISRYLLLDGIRKCTFNISYRLEASSCILRFRLEIMLPCALATRGSGKSFLPSPIKAKSNWNWILS